MQHANFVFGDREQRPENAATFPEQELPDLFIGRVVFRGSPAALRVGRQRGQGRFESIQSTGRCDRRALRRLEVVAPQIRLGVGSDDDKIAHASWDTFRSRRRSAKASLSD
jgi:hypothetical protein